MNTIIIIGRLTRDPEMRYTPNGKSVASFTVAVDRIGNDKGADFIRCSCWEKQAEFIVNYAKKGVQVAVEGRLRIDQDKESKTSYTTVVANRVQLLGSKKEDGQAQVEPGYNDGMDDDVPFD